MKTQHRVAADFWEGNRSACFEWSGLGGKPRSRQRGQALIEFALVLPLVLTLMFGVFEIAFIFYQDHTVNAACRMAVRWAAVSGASDTQVRTFIKNYCTNFDITDANITVQEYDSVGTKTVSGSPRSSGDNLLVSVTHNLIFLTSIQSVFRAAGVTTIRSSSQYIIE